MCFQQKKYTHSIVYNCRCAPHKNDARILRNFGMDDLKLLLSREHLIEYRYFRSYFGKLKVEKIIHCVMCNSFTKS